MDRVGLGPVKGLRIAMMAFVLSLFLLIAVLGLGAYLVTHKTNSVVNFSTELQEALVENCETVGNPLREAEVEDLKEGINSVDDPLIKVLFPEVPKSVADKLIRQSNAVKRERIEKVAPIDCASSYPSKP